jgi:hypothetical protein
VSRNIIHFVRPTPPPAYEDFYLAEDAPRGINWASSYPWQVVGVLIANFVLLGILGFCTMWLVTSAHATGFSYCPQATIERLLPNDRLTCLDRERQARQAYKRIVRDRCVCNFTNAYAVREGQ